MSHALTLKSVHESIYHDKKYKVICFHGILWIVPTSFLHPSINLFDSTSIHKSFWFKCRNPHGYGPLLTLFDQLNVPKILTSIPMLFCSRLLPDSSLNHVYFKVFTRFNFLMIMIALWIKFQFQLNGRESVNSEFQTCKWVFNLPKCKFYVRPMS